jgi:hypothetical protein
MKGVRGEAGASDALGLKTVRLGFLGVVR